MKLGQALPSRVELNYTELMMAATARRETRQLHFLFDTRPFDE